MLGLDNPIHLVFLLVLLLLVFGAKRLPEMGRSLGAGMRGFKESLSGEHVERSELDAGPHASAVANGAMSASQSNGAPGVTEQTTRA